MKPLVTQLHDEITYEFPTAGVCLSFSRLRETETGAVRGMLALDGLQQRNGAPEHLWWALVTLTTQSDRKTLVAKLDRAAKRDDGWEMDVDRVFQDCWERHTKVPSAIEAIDVPMPSLATSYQFEPIAPEGQVALLLADQGATKSYLMEYLSLCTVLNFPGVFGRPLRSGPALYFDWEVDARVYRRRAEWLCRGLGVELPRGLLYVNMSERGRLMDRIRDMRYQVDRVKPALVVIDSLTFATGGDLNSAEFAAPTMSAIGSLGDGITKLVSAHPNKASRNANIDDISVIGSGLFEFRARAIWLMKRETRRSARFGVSMVPRKPFDGAPSKPVSYRMVFDNTQQATHLEPMRLEDVPELQAGSMTLADRIRQTLSQHGKLTTLELAELLDAKPEIVKVECNRSPDVFAIFTGGGRGKPTTWALGEQNADPESLPWWTGDKP